MKKVFLSIFLMMSITLFAYNYPVSFVELFDKFKNEKQKIEVILSGSEVKNRGIVIISQTDYFVLKLDNGDVTIIPFSAVQEVSLYE